VQFDREPQLISWAQITARHQALNWLRSCKKQTVSLDDSVLDLMEAEWARESQRPEGEQIEALRQCLEALPDRSRQMIRLRYFEEQPCGEVARKLGVKLDAVYQRLTRLHRALGQCIQERLAADREPKAEAL
jgi:RNA polymerase sigma-70 factor (ECF subfamily)